MSDTHEHFAFGIGMFDLFHLDYFFLAQDFDGVETAVVFGSDEVDPAKRAGTESVCQYARVEIVASSGMEVCRGHHVSTMDPFRTRDAACRLACQDADTLLLPLRISHTIRPPSTAPAQITRRVSDPRSPDIPLSSTSSLLIPSPKQVLIPSQAKEIRTFVQ